MYQKKTERKRCAHSVPHCCHASLVRLPWPSLTNTDQILHIQSHLPCSKQSSRKMSKLSFEAVYRATKQSRLHNSFVSIDNIIRQCDGTPSVLSEARHSLHNHLKGSRQSNSPLQPILPCLQQQNTISFGKLLVRSSVCLE